MAKKNGKNVVEPEVTETVVSETEPETETETEESEVEESTVDETAVIEVKMTEDVPVLDDNGLPVRDEKGNEKTKEREFKLAVTIPNPKTVVLNEDQIRIAARSFMRARGAQLAKALYAAEASRIALSKEQFSAYAEMACKLGKTREEAEVLALELAKAKFPDFSLEVQTTFSLDLDTLFEIKKRGRKASA